MTTSLCVRPAAHPSCLLTCGMGDAAAAAVLRANNDDDADDIYRPAAGAAAAAAAAPYATRREEAFKHFACDVKLIVGEIASATSLKRKLNGVLRARNYNA